MLSVECAMALAEFMGEYAPTLLVLDCGIFPIDADIQITYLERLSEATRKHQTILTGPVAPPVPVGLRWNVIDLDI